MTAPLQTKDRAPLKPIVLNTPPMSDLSTDIMGGDLPVTAKGNRYLLCIICNVSKFTHAMPLRNLKAKTICDKLVEFFCFVGLPNVLRSNQMSSFRSELMTAVCEKFGIDLRYSCAFHSESHGGIERTNKTLEQMTRKYICDYPKSWDTMIHFLLFALREAKQSSTQFSPSELLFAES